MPLHIFPSPPKFVPQGTNAQESPAKNISNRFQNIQSQFKEKWQTLSSRTKFELLAMLSKALPLLVNEINGGKRNFIFAKDIADYLSGGQPTHILSKQLLAPVLPQEVTAIFAEFLRSGNEKNDSQRIAKLEFLFEKMLTETQEKLPGMGEEAGPPHYNLNTQFFDFIFYVHEKDPLPSIFQQNEENGWEKSTWKSIKAFTARVLHLFLEEHRFEGDSRLCEVFFAENEKGAEFHFTHRELIKSVILEKIRNQPNRLSWDKKEFGFTRENQADIVSYALFNETKEAEEFRQAILEYVKKIDEKFDTSDRESASDLLTTCAGLAFLKRKNGLPDNSENRKIFRDAIISGLQSKPPTVSFDVKLAEFAFLDEPLSLSSLPSWEAEKIEASADKPTLTEFNYLEEEEVQKENDENRKLLQNALIEWAKFDGPVTIKQNSIFNMSFYWGGPHNVPQACQEKFDEFKSALADRYKKAHTYPGYIPPANIVQTYLFSPGSPENEKLLSEIAFHAWLTSKEQVSFSAENYQRAQNEESGMFQRLISEQLDFSLENTTEDEINVLFSKLKWSSNRRQPVLAFLSNNLHRFSKDHVGTIEDLIANFKM